MTDIGSSKFPTKPTRKRVLELLGPSSGGIRRHVATLAKGLDRFGWTPTVAGPKNVMDGLDVDSETVEVSNSYDPRKTVSAVFWQQ